MGSKRIRGHLAAALTILIWGTTFISTKILLADFAPIEILFFRFLMGFLLLLVLFPGRLKGVSRRQEMIFAAAGFCGICMYYLLENIALTFTTASNVGVIISAAPFFTAILGHIFLKAEERLQVKFFLGFLISMAGVSLLSFQGEKLSVNPKGDMLALFAAFVWACYSILTRKIGSFGYPIVLTTRRTFFYGLLFMLPVLFFFDFSWDMTRFANTTYLTNMVYLGMGASAFCFVTWSFAVKVLGAVKTSIYIYLVPVITIVTAVLVLKESVTWGTAGGAVLVIAGLLLSGNNGGA